MARKKKYKELIHVKKVELFFALFYPEEGLPFHVFGITLAGT